MLKVGMLFIYVLIYVIKSEMEARTRNSYEAKLRLLHSYERALKVRSRPFWSNFFLLSLPHPNTGTQLDAFCLWSTVPWNSDMVSYLSLFALIICRTRCSNRSRCIPRHQSPSPCLLTSTPRRTFTFAATPSPVEVAPAAPGELFSRYCSGYPVV